MIDNESPCLYGDKKLEYSLEKHIAELKISEKCAVEIIDFRQEKYVVKYRQAAFPRYVRSWAASLVYALMFNEFVRPARLRAGSIEHEAARLRSLSTQGVRVPNVVLQTPGFLVLEYTGENISDVLAGLRGAERTAMLERVVDELADFHRAGHWHGGAQLRNITLHHDHICRIDFEEAAGAQISLGMMQAFDVVLTFHSAIDYFEGDVAWAADLLRRYFQRAPNIEVENIVRKMQRKLGWLLRLAPLLGPLARRKDLRRTLMLVQVL